MLNGVDKLYLALLSLLPLPPPLLLVAELAVSVALQKVAPSERLTHRPTSQHNSASAATTGNEGIKLKKKTP